MQLTNFPSAKAKAIKTFARTFLIYELPKTSLKEIRVIECARDESKSNAQATEKFIKMG